MARTFSNVTFEAEHVTEQHRTLENDHTVTTVELPGVVNLYAVFDGGRVLMDQIKAPVVLEAIDRAQAAQQKADAERKAAEQQAAQQESARQAQLAAAQQVQQQADQQAAEQQAQQQAAAQTTTDGEQSQPTE